MHLSRQIKQVLVSLGHMSTLEKEMSLMQKMIFNKGGQPLISFLKTALLMNDIAKNMRQKTIIYFFIISILQKYYSKREICKFCFFVLSKLGRGVGKP